MSGLGYSHVHFAFANITSNFQIDISGAQKQFDGLKNLKNIKRIVSFGGWSFSTSPDSAPIFRQGVTADQRATFVNNVVKFLNDNGLDGVDFDWEYPGVSVVVLPILPYSCGSTELPMLTFTLEGDRYPRCRIWQQGRRSQLLPIPERVEESYASRQDALHRCTCVILVSP